MEVCPWRQNMRNCAICEMLFDTGWSTYWCSRPCWRKQVRKNKRGQLKKRVTKTKIQSNHAYQRTRS